MSESENVHPFIDWVIEKFFTDLRKKEQDLQVSAMIRDQLDFIILCIGLDMDENSRLYSEQHGVGLIIPSKEKLLSDIRHLLQTRSDW